MRGNRLGGERASANLFEAELTLFGNLCEMPPDAVGALHIGDLHGVRTTYKSFPRRDLRPLSRSGIDECAAIVAHYLGASIVELQDCYVDDVVEWSLLAEALFMS